MRDFVDRMIPPEPGGPVYYLQSQNDNLNSELAPLREDVESVTLNAHTQALNTIFGCDKPDAVNVWIGDGRSVTSLHKGECDGIWRHQADETTSDPYENLYYVIRGSKTFTLLPPTEFYCLHGRCLQTSSSKAYLIPL